MDWVLALKNEMSGPAQQVVSSLKAVEKELAEVQRMSKLNDIAKMDPGLAKHAATLGLQHDDLLAQANAQKQAQGEMAAVSQAGAAAMTEGFTAVAGVLTTVLTIVLAITAAIAAVAGVAGALAAKFFSIATASADWKENTLIAFSTLLKSDALGQQMLDNAVKFAAHTPFQTDVVVGGFKSLLAGGFRDMAQMNQLMLGIGDLASIKGDPAVVGQLTEAFGRLNGEGKLSDEIFRTLRGAGVQQSAVYAELGKTLHKTTPEIEKMISAGKITSGQGITAIMEAMKNTTSGGKLGSIMDKQSQTLTGLLSTIASAPLQLTADVNTTPAYKSLKGLLSNVSSALDPDSPSGKALKKGSQDLFEGLFGSFGMGSGKQAGAQIAAIFKEVGEDISAIGNFLKSARPIVDAFFGGLSEGFKAAWGPIKAFGGALSNALGSTKEDQVRNLTIAMKGIGEVIGFVVTMLAALTLAFGAMAAYAPVLLTEFGGIFAEIVESGTDAVSGMYGVGSDFVQGFIDGIDGGVASVVDAAKNMALSAKNATISTLLIGSPSKVMHELGGFTAEGFANGVDAGADDAQASMANMVAPPAGGRGGGGAGGASFVNNITVHVSGSGDAKATAQAVGDELEDRMAMIMERWASMMGLVTSPQGSPALT